MNSALDDIRQGLLQGRYVNEASVSTGIVLRILADLGWNTFDPSQVSPEFTVANQRVDFALLVNGQPRVFVEVKRPGKGAEAEYQLFQYAFHKGVQMVVLTTGQEWSFFLPAEPGEYLDRRVYFLDLLERDSQTSSDRFLRYLGRERVVSGVAFGDWRNDYRDKTNRNLALKAIPNAWLELVEQQDSTLIDLVCEKAESISGFRPDAYDVILFLLSLEKPGRTLLGNAVKKPSPKPPPTTTPVSSVETEGAQVGYSINGTWTPVRRGREILIGVFSTLHDLDSTFLERYAARFTDGKHRPVIAKSKSELYPRNPGFSDRYPKDSREFIPGWFIDLNMSTAQTEQVIRKACEVARLTFGSDVRVSFPPSRG